MPLGAAKYPTDLGEAELVAGDPARSVDLLRSSCSTLDRLGDRNRLATLAPITARTLLALGRRTRGSAMRSGGGTSPTRRTSTPNTNGVSPVSGLRSRQGRHDEAIALSRESVALLATSQPPRSQRTANMALAGALRAAGDEAGALGAAHEAERLATARQDVASLRKVAASLEGG